MARSWVEDLWVRPYKSDIDDSKVYPPAAQMRGGLKKLDDRFKTSRFGKGARWRVNWYETKNGVKTKRTKAFNFIADAEAYQAELEDSIRSGKYTPPEHAEKTVREVSELWLAGKKKVAQVTLKRADDELRTYVLPRWGDVKLRELDPDKINAWVSELEDGTAVRAYIDADRKARKLGPSSIRHLVQVTFGGIVRLAVKRRWIAESPLDGVELPVDEKTARKAYLTYTEVDALAAAAEQVDRDVSGSLVRWLAFTGTRINEALALRVEDVNLTKRRAYVHRTWSSSRDGKKIETDPKQHEIRHVPIQPHLIAELALLMHGRPGSDYVFRASRGGGPMDAHNWRNRVFANAVEGAGLGEVEGLTPHALRHTCASLAIAAGCDVITLQAMLGHKDATHTLNTYAELWPDRLDTVTTAMSEARAAELMSTEGLPGAGGEPAESGG